MDKANGTILLVDDDEGFRCAASKVLENAGFTVSAAPDYRAALEVLDGGLAVDLLVTDVFMPGRMHGFPLARMARMRRLGLKVIFVTGMDVPAIEANGAHVLRKPISNEGLADAVRLAIAR
jgi:CheY-like chemotaxis protein